MAHGGVTVTSLPIIYLTREAAEERAPRDKAIFRPMWAAEQPAEARARTLRRERDHARGVLVYVDQSDGSHQRAIEFLAHESQVPITEVTQLYEDELADLRVGARITAFLGIFTFRKVREILRKRSTGKRLAA